MKKARINKIIKYNGKEYAHIIEPEPNQFCDLCCFSKTCSNVLNGALDYHESPMCICSELCNEADTDFAMFIESEIAKDYINAINKEFYGCK